MGFFITRKVTLKVEVKSNSNTELHRITLVSGTATSFDLIKEMICSRINLAKDASLSLSYQDEDGELVRLMNDSDLEDALVIQKLSSLRIFLKVSEPDVGMKESASKETPQVTETPSSPAGGSTSSGVGVAPAVIEELFKHVRKVVRKSEDRAIDVAHVVDSLSAILVDNINRSVDMLPGVLNKRPSSTCAETGAKPSSSGEGVPAAQHIPLASTVELSGSAPESGGANKTGTGKEPVLNEGEEDFPARVFHSRVQCDGCGMLPIVGPRFKSTVKDDYDLCVSCHSRADDKQSYSRIDRPLFKPRHGLWGHRHVRRGCGPPPGALFGGRPFVPAGPRVSTGWATCGPYSDAAYARGTLPPVTLGGGAVHGDAAGPKGPPPPSGHMHVPLPCDPDSQQRFRDLGAWGANISWKLDSRFVCDVSIFDGTELAPGTQFTKIWRMRNNGNTNWPPGTALTHIGGDTLATVASVILPVPPQGVPVDEEVDIAVDAVAPMLPGRYVSHWRLVAPNGPKFGHRVWMLIQVVPKGEISPQEAMLLKVEEGEASAPVLQQQGVDVSQSENAIPASEPLPEFFGSAVGSTSSSMLLVPPPPTPPALEKGVSVEEVVKRAPTDVAGILSEAAQYLSQVAAREGSMTETELPAPTEASMKPKSDAGSTSEDSVPAKSTTKVELVATEDLDSASSPNTGRVDQEIAYPEVIPLATSPAAVAAPEEVVSRPEEESNQAGDSVSVIRVHASALIQLKAMGFHDAVLNVELLEKNHGDIQSTVDDLVAAEEWDPMLEELEEMGFTDIEVNRRLMFKNKGSVKQVVKELVEMYTSGSATLAK